MTAPARTFNAAQPAANVPDANRAYPALRQENQPDPLDGKRLDLVHGRWNAQNGVRLPFERQVEEHCRLLAGRQWDVWSENLGRFVDVSLLLTEEERLWRKRPVVNYLSYWYLLTHARLTENPPIITFQPATADRVDAQLAQTLDTIYKTVWNDAHVSEAIDRLMGWVVAAGVAYLKSWPDQTRGDEHPRVGPASVTLPHPQTGEPTEFDLDQPVPYTKDGMPQFMVQQADDGDLHAVPTAEVEYEKDGQIAVCVLNPTQVRGEWNNKPWHEKAWHIHRDYYPVEYVEQSWGVKVHPDAMTGAPGATISNGPGYLERLLFGDGYYGSTERGGMGGLGGASSSGLGLDSGTGGIDRGVVRVDEYWERPSDQNDNQGRHLVVTETEVLYDGPNPFPKLTGPSPIRCFEFVGIPGRPSGTTPMEFLVPLQRQMNAGWAQALEHNALMTNPMLLADEAAGLDDAQFQSIPGTIITGGLRNGQPMVQPFNPPNLSADFWKIQEMVRDTIMFLGNLSGTEGTPPTNDPSGELVSQLRANSDRFVGPTARQMVTEIARMADDWTAILSVLWTEPKLILTAGEDNVPMTVAVEPYLWDGNARAVPDVGSMLPESRSAKQARIMASFQAGLFGNPLADPKAAEWARQMMNFPEMNRAMQPGGVSAVTANHALGKVIMGEDPTQIPLLEPYDMSAWGKVLGDYVSSPEFLANKPEIQQAIMVLFQRAKQFAQMQQIGQAGEQAGLQGAALGAAAQANPLVAKGVADQMQPPEPPNPGGNKQKAQNAAPPVMHPGPQTPQDLSPAQNAPQPLAAV